MPKAANSKFFTTLKKKEKEDGLEKKTGVRVGRADPIPAFYQRFFKNHFEEDLGDGDFTFNWAAAGQVPNVRFQTFVTFDMRLKKPCAEVATKQYKKVYVFIQKEGGDFELDTDESQFEQSLDTPSGNPNPNMLDPGETESRGGSSYWGYDPPGPPSPNRDPSVTAIRVRVAFFVEILCDGAVVQTFYWLYEATLPYINGLPQPYSAGSGVSQISKAAYDDEQQEMRKNHAA